MCVGHSAVHLHHCCHHSHCLHHTASRAQHRCLSSHTWGGLLGKLCCVDSDHESHLKSHYPYSHSHHCRPEILQTDTFQCCKIKENINPLLHKLASCPTLLSQISLTYFLKFQITLIKLGPQHFVQFVTIKLLRLSHIVSLITLSYILHVIP